MDASTPDNAGASLKRRRVRIPKSCIPCLKGKRACDRERPACGRCVRSGQPSECSYDARLATKQQQQSSGDGRRRNKQHTSELKRSVSSTDASDSDDNKGHLDNDDSHAISRHPPHSRPPVHSYHHQRPPGDAADEVAMLRVQLDVARREARELHEIVQRQQQQRRPLYSAPFPHHTQHAPESSYPASHPVQARAHAAPTHNKALSGHSDLDAVTGLQMLAEMAGPAEGRSGGDANGRVGPIERTSRSAPACSSADCQTAATGSAACYDRSKMSSIASVLNWPDEGSRYQQADRSAGSPRSEPALAFRPRGPDSGLTAASAITTTASSSDPSLSPSSSGARSQASTGTSSCQSTSATIKDIASPVNRNGFPIYYGEVTSGDVVLRQVKDEHAAARTQPPPTPLSASHGGGGGGGGSVQDARSGSGSIGDTSPQRPANAADSAESHANTVKNDIQTAFNRLLDPSRDSFPFTTVWSSGDRFFEEVLPFFPTPDEFDAICRAFVRHFSSMCSSLMIPCAIEYARAFSTWPRERQAATPLPWLAVFLMICAMGINCDLENTIAATDSQGRRQHIDALLSGRGGTVGTVGTAGTVGDPSSASGATVTSPRLNNIDGSKNSSSSSLQPSPSSRNRPSLSPRGKAWSPALLSDLYLSATYQALRLCSFLSSPTLQTIHAQLLIGSYMLNTERASSFWPLLGSVARQCQSIGLHVDPELVRVGWSDEEKDIRRRTWWAVVHQDVILSGIFGRPLGITRFSTHFPASQAPPPESRSFALLQCELSQFARTALDEHESWTQRQVDMFTDRVEKWYADIPRQYRIDSCVAAVDPMDSQGEAEAMRNYQVAGVDPNVRRLMEVHQSCNLAIEVSHVLLSLHRLNLVRSGGLDADELGRGPTGGEDESDKLGDEADIRSDSSSSVGQRRSASASAGRIGDEGDRRSSDSDSDGPGQVNKTGLLACARYVRETTKAQQIMTERLGRARAGMFWKVSYYTYQAAVAGADIVFLRPSSECAASALKDLGKLTEIFDRSPDRWHGLQMAKGGLRVLYKLAAAARDNPEAASMPRTAQACQQPAMALTPLPILAESDPFGVSGSGSGGGGVVGTGFGIMLDTATKTASEDSMPPLGNGGGGLGAHAYGHGRGPVQSAIPSRLLLQPDHQQQHQPPQQHQQHALQYQQQQQHRSNGSTPFTMPLYPQSPGTGRMAMAFGSNGVGGGAHVQTQAQQTQYDAAPCAFLASPFSVEQYLGDGPIAVQQPSGNGGWSTPATAGHRPATGDPALAAHLGAYSNLDHDGGDTRLPGSSGVLAGLRMAAVGGVDVVPDRIGPGAYGGDGPQPLAHLSTAAASDHSKHMDFLRTPSQPLAPGHSLFAPGLMGDSGAHDGPQHQHQLDTSVGGGGGWTSANAAHPNTKDLANYWSDYFSLQLDWDRLSTLG